MLLRHILALSLLAALPAAAQSPASADVPATAATPGKQPFTVERSWQIQRLGNPVVSPDGSLIVAPVTRFEMKEDKAYTDLWIWNADGSGERAFTTHVGNEGSPAFSPDGRFIAFTAQREDD
ncbi:TolB family protein, partial [Silanimonas sp.]